MVLQLDGGQLLRWPGSPSWRDIIQGVLLKWAWIVNLITKTLRESLDNQFLMIFLRLGLGAVVARWVQVRRPQNKGEDSGTRWHYNCLQMLKMIRLPFWDNLAQVKLFISFLLRGQDLWFWILFHKCEEMGLAHKHRKSSNLSFGAIFIHMKKIIPSLLFETILQDKASIKSCSTDNARNKYDVWVKLQSLVLGSELVLMHGSIRCQSRGTD